MGQCTGLVLPSEQHPSVFQVLLLHLHRLQHVVVQMLVQDSSHVTATCNSSRFVRSWDTSKPSVEMAPLSCLALAVLLATLQGSMLQMRLALSHKIFKQLFMGVETMGPRKKEGLVSSFQHSLSEKTQNPHVFDSWYSTPLLSKVVLMLSHISGHWTNSNTETLTLDSYESFFLVQCFFHLSCTYILNNQSNHSSASLANKSGATDRLKERRPLLQVFMLLFQKSPGPDVREQHQEKDRNKSWWLWLSLTLMLHNFLLLFVHLVMDNYCSVLILETGVIGGEPPHLKKMGAKQINNRSSCRSEHQHVHNIAQKRFKNNQIWKSCLRDQVLLTRHLSNISFCSCYLTVFFCKWAIGITCDLPRCKHNTLNCPSFRHKERSILITSDLTHTSTC